MEHFDTYSTHPAVHTIDTMSICMKKFGCWKSLSLWNGSCVHIVIFSCLLSAIKGNVCAIIVHLWIEATPATVLMTVHEPWPLHRYEKVQDWSGFPDWSLAYDTGPRSAVGNMSGNRCESDCRSRGSEFDPGPVPYFRGDWSWNNFYGHSPPFRWIIQEGLLSVTSESMCTKYWLTACSSLPRKKCGKVNWPSRNGHSCWHGT